MNLKKLLLTTVLLGSLCTGACAEDLNLLAIGNSFTLNAVKYLPQIAKSFPDCGLNLFVVYHSGSTLAYHWNKVSVSETNSAVVYEKYKGKDCHTLKDLLGAEKWDVVVALQQYGPTKERFSDAQCEPYAGNLYRYVQTNAPGAEIMIHQTWAYREDWDGLDKFGKTYPRALAMYDVVNACHVAMAKKYNARILPSGAAMRLCQERHPFVPDPKFDYKTPVYPSLPQEQWSLHMGPWWRMQADGKYEYVYDWQHAGLRGEYMMGCLWFEMLFKKDARTITFKPDTLTNEEAAELRAAAHDTAATFVQPCTTDFAKGQRH